MYLQSTGDVVGRTTQHERIWGFLGAVVHWIYPTSLRVRAVEVWDGLLVWTSALGALAFAIGLVLGLTLRVIAKRHRLRSRGRHPRMTRRDSKRTDAMTRTIAAAAF